MGRGINIKNLSQHETKREVLYRYSLLVLIVFAYFLFLSYKYGFAQGGLLSLLTWSFFVLCTPIADAGFLLDFPLRVVAGIRMLHSEIVVWTIAITTNILALNFHPQLYQSTILTKIFRQILLHPWPYWLIIFLSAAGTFLSVVFGDELLDVIKHRDRAKFHQHGFLLKLISMVFVFAGVFIVYDILISRLGVKF